MTDSEMPPVEELSIEYFQQRKFFAAWFKAHSEGKSVAISPPCSHGFHELTEHLVMATEQADKHSGHKRSEVARHAKQLGATARAVSGALASLYSGNDEQFERILTLVDLGNRLSSAYGNFQYWYDSPDKVLGMRRRRQSRVGGHNRAAKLATDNKQTYETIRARVLQEHKNYPKFSFSKVAGRIAPKAGYSKRQVERIAIEVKW